VAFVFAELDKSCIRQAGDESHCRRQGAVGILRRVPPRDRTDSDTMVKVSRTARGCRVLLGVPDRIRISAPSYIPLGRDYGG